MKIETLPKMDFNWIFNGALQKRFYREKSYMLDRNLCAKRCCVSKNYFFI